MNRMNKNRIIKLEGDVGVVERHKSALIIYDPNAEVEFDLSKIEADVIIALPDNGRGDLGDMKALGGLKVSYF